MELLKNCPFCGSPEVQAVRKSDLCLCYVRCLKCGSRGPAAAVLDIATHMWNDRDSDEEDYQPW